VSTATGSSGIQLRDYQRDAIAGLHRAWSGVQRGTGTGVANRAAVVLPTGAGKTVVFAHPDLRAPIIGAAGSNPRGRMLVLVHRDELATQAVAKLHAIDPGASVGRVQNVWDETDRQIIVASVQTLARADRRDRLQDVALVVVDEAHHAVAPTYLRVLEHFGCFSSTPTAGFSATLARSEEDKHLGDVWQEVVLRRDVLDGIKAGWLVDVHGKSVQIEGLDLRDVKRTAGDYSDGDLGEHLRAADAPEQVADAVRELASDRQGITFWPDIATAEAGADAYNEAGIPAAVIKGETSTPERADVYRRYRRGDLAMLSSCMVLTEGFDMPQASVAVIARPTQSTPLYVQMAGRVLRPWHLPVPGFALKRDALLLDVVGISGQHKLATLADLSVTVKRVKGDQSLAEAGAQEELRESGDLSGWSDAVVIDPATGRRVIQDVDLFGERSSVWLQTRAGTWFIPAGDWIVFLWPEDSGLWMLGTTGSRAVPGQAQVISGGMTLDWAMNRAEDYAGRITAAIGKGRLDARAASWRKGQALASEAQRRFAAGLGHPLPEGTTKAQASDIVSVALATRALGG
jgi:superfamily II DNA or RNA helicase